MSITHNSLRILHWNANGIRRRINEFFSYLSRNQILVACVNETKLNHRIRFNNSNYRVFQLDNSEGIISSGGIAIIVHKSLKCQLLPWIDTKTIQCLGINISFRDSSFNINIISAYFNGAPQTHDFNLFRDDLIKISQMRNFVLLGDLNSRHPYWGCFNTNRAGRILYQLINENRFDIHFPDSSTYFSGSYRRPSTIDLVLKNSSIRVNSLEVSYEIQSDHLPILLDLNVHCHRNDLQVTPIPCYSRANWTRFKTIIDRSIDLNYFSLTPDCSTTDIDDRVSKLTDLIIRATNQSVPLYTPRHDNPNVPQSLLNLIHERRRLRRQFVRNGRPFLIGQKIAQLTRQIDHEFVVLHNATFQRNVSRIIPNEDFNRKLFKLTKCLRGPRCRMGPLKDNTNFYVSNNEKANALASAFERNHSNSQSVHHNLSFNRRIQTKAEQIRSISCKNDISEIFFKPSEICLALRSLKNGKSPGQDQIRNEALKNASRKLIVAITLIFNACLQLSYFPKAWRHAITTPVPKPNKPHSCPSSYRPISLLSTLSKVFERLILDRLKDSLQDKIPNYQFGFKQGHSTCHQIRRVVKYVKSNFSQGYSTGMVLLDLKSAFDSVWHDGLIWKLANSPCPLYLVRLIQSFLSDRTFSVRVDQEHSRTLRIPTGVPQGAVLSPFLFNFFLSDLPSPERCFLAQFADDIAALTSNKSPRFILSRLQTFVDQFDAFCKKWRLALNPDKTESIYFTRRTSPRFYPSRGITVQRHECPWSDHAKYLGVFLDRRLTYAKHMNHAITKSGNTIKSLFSVINRRSRLHVKNKLLIFKSIIRPNYMYGCQIWGDCADVHLKKLQVVQNKILKMCYDLPYDFPTIGLHEIDKIDPIKTYASNLMNKFVDKCQSSEWSIIRDLV